MFRSDDSFTTIESTQSYIVSHKCNQNIRKSTQTLQNMAFNSDPI